MNLFKKLFQRKKTEYELASERGTEFYNEMMAVFDDIKKMIARSEEQDKEIKRLNRALQS